MNNSSKIVTWLQEFTKTKIIKSSPFLLGFNYEKRIVELLVIYFLSIVLYLLFEFFPNLILEIPPTVSYSYYITFSMGFWLLYYQSNLHKLDGIDNSENILNRIQKSKIILSLDIGDVKHIIFVLLISAFPGIFISFLFPGSSSSLPEALFTFLVISFTLLVMLLRTIIRKDLASAYAGFISIFALAILISIFAIVDHYRPTPTSSTSTITSPTPTAVIDQTPSNADSNFSNVNEFQVNLIDQLNTLLKGKYKFWIALGILVIMVIAFLITTRIVSEFVRWLIWFFIRPITLFFKLSRKDIDFVYESDISVFGRSYYYIEGISIILIVFSFLSSRSNFFLLISFLLSLFLYIVWGINSYRIMMLPKYNSTEDKIF